MAGLEIGSSSTLENGHYWDGYLEDDLPDKTQGKMTRNLRHRLFTLYRRLFGVVFIINMAIFVVTLIHNQTSALHLGLVVTSNLFCSILVRQDYVINAFFTVFCSIPRS